MREQYMDKLMHLQMEHGKKILIVEHRLKRSNEAIEEKDAQIARLMGATSTDTSIAMAMNVKTEVISFIHLICFFEFVHFFIRSYVL